ncbi:uncharacterized protein LOC125178291 [Hyalella azteca]|uniref:Uncharacterized protein LOC125178291 n=1 Tax=Hyalella azteca TaxID=294128 RepID=A0A979FN88_HYAAZ|nr:uncharacterized protein LOC125178291 [Hyalella azteca]
MQLPKYFMNKFLLLIIVLDCAASAKMSGHFYKVQGNVVDYGCSMSNSTTAEAGLDLSITCGSLCQRYVNCRFFCFIKSTGLCGMFTAYVAVRWPGHPAFASTTTYDACYTSWGDPRDIVKTNSPFTYSSNEMGSYPKYGTDGYACLTTPAYFSTLMTTNTFSQIDLEQTTRVQAVILVTAWIGLIQDMDVILSNTSDYNLGQKIGRVNGIAPAWSPYTIVTNTSTAGRYLTFFTAMYGFLGFAEVQVIPQP